MKHIKIRGFLNLFTLLIIPAVLLNTSGLKAQTEKKQKVEFLVKKSEQKVDVLVNGKLITSYCWPDNVYKPVLYPVYTLRGTEITRGFPLRPREGERDDHIHQVGVWLNYGNVNGFDFWGNGSTGKKSENGGVIKQVEIEQTKDGYGEGLMTIKASWQDPSGKELLMEKTDFHFIAKNHLYIIDRITTLTATGSTVSMNDTKEGMFAIRVARQLELPSKENVTLLDAQGQPGNEKAMENRGVTGNYRSSEGITGEAVWSTRAKWMDLYGTISNEDVSWLFAIIRKILHTLHTGMQEVTGCFQQIRWEGRILQTGRKWLTFLVPAGMSVTFRYRMIITSGIHLNDKEINDLAAEFSGKY